MVGLDQLVSESLARHGVEASLDPQRLRWSKWFCVESCLSFVRVPDQGGIFVLAEELIRPEECHRADGKRMLAVYRISETDHLGMTMARLFLPGRPEAARLTTGRSIARYAVVEDVIQRHAALAALQQWIASSSDAATGITAASDAAMVSQSSNKEAQFGPSGPVLAEF